jgi:hypothetical protein
MEEQWEQEPPDQRQASQIFIWARIQTQQHISIAIFVDSQSITQNLKMPTSKPNPQSEEHTND